MVGASETGGSLAADLSDPTDLDPNPPSASRFLRTRRSHGRRKAGPHAVRAGTLTSMQELLLAWYSQNKRDLPWRRTRDPYAILVSEVMLQQSPTGCRRAPEIPVTMRDREVASASTIARRRAKFQPDVRTVFAPRE